ncbi:TPA: hypothetical protein ACUQ49_003316 [Escherichia coli]
MGGFVNIKTFTHPAGEGKEVKGMEVSVAFDVYSNEPPYCRFSLSNLSVRKSSLF